MRTKHRRGALRLVAAATLPFGLAGCLSLPQPPRDLASRHVDTPEAFAAAAGSQWIGAGWIGEFNSDQLVALVEEALRRNPDLYTAAARIEEAEARLRVAGALLRPQLDGFGGASRADNGITGPANTYDLGLQVGWEIDLWGRLRSSRAAATSVVEAAGLDYVQARHSLAAAVSEAYFSIITAREQLAIDRELLAVEQFTAETTRQRVAAGVAISLDEDLAVANVALAEAAIQQSLSALQESQRALEILLGRYPSGVLDPNEGLPAVPGPVSTGVPSELLERRPDVLAAARRVDAAFYNVQQARAARLPSLTLSSSVGTLLDPDELFWSIAGDIFAPIYTGGRLRAEVEAAGAQQRQALGQYASTALEAFREVETALANEQYLAAQEAELATASERLRRASQTADNRYQNGVMTILELIQVRRQDFQTRSQLLGVRFERLRQRLNLYLALGGRFTPPKADRRSSRTDRSPTMAEEVPSHPPVPERRRKRRQVAHLIRQGVPIVVLLVVLLGVWLYWNEADHAPGPAEAMGPQGPLPVSAIVVEPRNVPIQAQYLAQTEESQTVPMRARVSGFLTERGFQEGEAVEQGQLLFRIDPRPFEVTLAQAQAQLSAAEARLQRANQQLRRFEELATQQSAAANELEQWQEEQQVAAAEVEVQQTRIAQAELDLGYTTIQAPIDGVIGQSLQDVGSYINPVGGDALLATVRQVDPLFVRFSVSERDLLDWQRMTASGAITNVPVDQLEVEVVLPDGRVHPHLARIDFVDVAVDPTTGTAVVRATVPNPEGSLLPGQFVHVRISGVERVDAMLVPQSAVMQMPTGSAVYVVDANGTAQIRPVTVGQWQGQDWIIETGLEPGDRVIASHMLQVRPGMPVDPQIESISAAGDPATRPTTAPASGQ